MKAGDFQERKSGGRLEAFSTAVDDAARAAIWEAAVRWGAIALGGAFFVGVFVCVWGENDRLTSVLSAWNACGCAVFFGAAGAARAFRRRPSLFVAARRWERRFPECAGILTAAVDFEANEGGAADSAALRRATVETAIRRFEDSARTLDAAERRAVLTGLPVGRLRKIGKTGAALALGTAVNWGVFGALGDWGKAGGEAKIASSELETGEAARSETLSEKTDEPNGGETAATARNEETARNGENSEAGGDGADEEKEAEISVATLELLSGDLARSAEIARTLEAGLRDVASGRREENEETEAATALLFLARELETNFERPGSGVDAQIRRLRAAARRERDEILARWGKAGGLEKMGELRKTGSGRETAVFLLAARLEGWETARRENENARDVASRGLNVALRSDSEAERTQAAASAAEGVGRWAALLRREEAAIQALTECWRFDAASLDVENALSRAAAENNALLTKFAGRSAFETNENEGEADERAARKRRVAAYLDAARTALNAQIAIFERLRERLRSGDGAEFAAFAERALKSETLGRENETADRAALDAVDDWASRWEERRASVAENVENNRFGKAATALSADVEPARIAEGETLGGASGRETEKARAAATAFRLTFGGNGTRRTWKPGEQTLADVGVATNRKAGGETLATARSELDGEAETAAERLESTTEEEANAKNGAVSASDGDASADKIASWGETTRSDGGESGEIGGDVGESASVGTGGAASEKDDESDWEVVVKEAFNGELPSEARRRIEKTLSPRVAPEYEEKTRLYRRRIADERRR